MEIFNPNDAGEGQKRPRNAQWLNTQKSYFSEEAEILAMPT